MSAVENIRSALEKWRKAKTMQEACEADDEYGDATDQDVMADAPYPGMIEAFEAHYGQSFTDKDWSNEASTWAAAWGYATRQASSEDLQSQQDKEIGKKWREDSRLEEWFPLTHEEHLRLQVEVANLREQLAQRGEPTFWLNEVGQLSATRGFAARNAPGFKLVPLYTHPQAPREQLMDKEHQDSWNHKCRLVVDALLHEAGYHEDSSVRHNLAMMNFDASTAVKEQLAQQAPQVAHPGNLEQIGYPYLVVDSAESMASVL